MRHSASHTNNLHVLLHKLTTLNVNDFSLQFGDLVPESMQHCWRNPFPRLCAQETFVGETNVSEKKKKKFRNISVSRKQRMFPQQVLLVRANGEMLRKCILVCGHL